MSKKIFAVLILGLLLFAACNSTVEEPIEDNSIIAKNLVADFITENYPSVVLSYGHKLIISANVREIIELNGGIPRGIDLNGRVTFSFELFNLDDSGYYSIFIRKGWPESGGGTTVLYRFNGLEYVEVDRFMMANFFRDENGNLIMVESHELGGPAIYSYITFEDGNPNLIKNTFIDDDYTWEMFSSMRETHESVVNQSHVVDMVTNAIYLNAMRHNNQFISWRERYSFFIMNNSWWSEPPRLFDENSGFAVLHGEEIPFLIAMNRATGEYILFRYNEALSVVERVDDGGGIILEGITFSSDIWQFMYALYGENVPTERVAGNQTNISLTEAERLVADFMLQKYPSVVLDNLYMSLMAPNLEQIRELNGGLPRGIDGAFTFSFELFSFDDSGYYTVGVRRGLPETCAVSTFFYRYNGVEYVEVMRGSGSFFKSTAGHLMFIESRELGGPAIISNIILDGHHVIKHTLIDDDYDWEIAEEIRQTHEAIESYEQKVLRITNTIYEEAMEHTNQFLSWREHYLFFIQTNLWWTEPPRLFDENSAFAILHGGENPFLIVMNRATQEYRLFRYSENLNIVEEIDDGGGMRLEGIEFFGDIWQFTVNLYGRG